MGILGTIHGLWTLVLLIVFVAIAVWAWSAKRRESFEAASRIPFEDDDEETDRRNAR